MAKTYDIAVLGATAAGYASALTLARTHQVVLLDGARSATESPLADWIPADVFGVCPALRRVKTTGTDGAFRAVEFHSAQLDRSASYRSRSAAGYVLRSAKFLKALDQAARRAGVRRVRVHERVEPDLQESAVVLPAGRRTLRASLLLIAQDSPQEVVTALRLPVRSVPTGHLNACGLDLPLPRGRADTPPGSALHVVAVPGGERVGMFFVAGNVLHVRIVSAGTSTPAGADELGQLISDLRDAGLVPAKLNLARATAARWRPPGGVALELETHLAKRTLLVGTAGGFAAALAGQTLDASIRSAMVAAEVVAKALKSDRPQEVLADYKSQWRDLLADRIRPTGTSVQMLMPMVLSNEAMAQRFARALLYGDRL